MNTITQIDNTEFKYALLQVSSGHFGSSFNALTDEQRFEAEKIARNQVSLHSKILLTPESGQVVISDVQIQQEIDNIIARYSSEDEFHSELQANELNIELLKEAISRSVRVEAIMELVSASVIECSETDAKLYYYMNEDKFQQPETRNARHILITVNPDFPENSRTEAFKRAESVSQRLQKKPKRFPEQALKYSECPTAMNGGELGRIKRGVLFPSLDAELFSMKVGKVSDVVESPIGFHVLYCEDIFLQGSVPLSDALPKIIEKLTERNRKNHQRSWLKNL